MKRPVSTLLLILMISTLSPLRAQGWKLIPREEIEAQVHPDLLKQAGHLLRFDTCRLSVGTLLEEDAPRTVAFRFRNISQQPITLTKVTTSCGCTVAKFSQEPLAPQAESILYLTYNPKNRPGTVDAQALVYTTLSQQSPVAKLTLCGYVKSGDEWNHLPQSMGTLRLNRKQVTFSQAGALATERILCGNSGDHPLTLKAAMLPEGLKCHTEPAVLAPGQEGDLVITLDTRKLPPHAAQRKRFTFLLNGVTGKPSERMIEVIIKN